MAFIKTEEKIPLTSLDVSMNFAMASFIVFCIGALYSVVSANDPPVGGKEFDTADTSNLLYAGLAIYSLDEGKHATILKEFSRRSHTSLKLVTCVQHLHVLIV